MIGKRVVITGLGIICPVGNVVEEAWRNVCTGKSGIHRLADADGKSGTNEIVGSVLGFDPVAKFGSKEARRMDRVTQLGLTAADEALKDSGLSITDDNTYDIGCLVGSGLGAMEALEEYILGYHTKGYKSVSAIAMPRMLIDSIAGRISLEFKLRGPNFNISSACATGNNSIGEAASLIQLGRANVMLAGASEAPLTGTVLAAFNNMKALSGYTGDPEKASRPFDLQRDGFVCAEGAAVLVLENHDHALARGARIYAELTGYGHTSDAYHVTAPREDGEGAARAVKLALHEAGLTPTDIDYINAHGTSTPLNDKSETISLKKALGETAYTIPISSTKSETGHLLGAAGAVEAVFSVLAIRDNFIPPTINLEHPDPDCDLDYTPNLGRAHAIDHVMSNSFGFGGHNTVLIFSRYNG